MEILHPALDVFDMDTTVAFYEDLLGLHRTRETEIDGQQHYFVGGAGLAELQLIAVKERESPGGFNHLAVAVTDIDSVVEEAVTDWGSLVEREPQMFKGVRLAFITDPEGYTVELIEERE